MPKQKNIDFLLYIYLFFNQRKGTELTPQQELDLKKEKILSALNWIKRKVLSQSSPTLKHRN